MNILNPNYTIFKSRKFSFEWDKENDNRYVKAIEDIYKGDLLLIEHTITAETDDNYNPLVMNILYNEDLFNQLYPRNTTYNLDDILNNSDKNEYYCNAITDKIKKNCFKVNVDNKEFTSLPVDFVKFNHSKDPNVNFHYIYMTVPNLKSPIIIFYAICCKDIKKDEELFNNYGNEYFNEDIDLTDYKDKASDIFKKNKNKILDKVDKYLESKECKDVLFNHHFTSNGLVYIQKLNHYVGLSKFRLVVNKDENKDVLIPDMNDWINREMLNIFLTFKEKFKKIKPIKCSKKGEEKKNDN